MPNTISFPQLSAATQTGRPIPMRNWYPSGYRLSVWSSLLAAVAIGVCFIGGAGWRPPEGRESDAAFGVTWLVLTYIWFQMGSLVVAGAGSKSQMWVDALTSIVPLFLIVYLLCSITAASSLFRRSRRARRGPRPTPCSWTS
jgi:hypothetical protein